METTTIKRLREAAALASESDVVLTVNVDGIQARSILSTNGRHYIFDKFTSWIAIERCNGNPLALAIVMLMTEIKEFQA